MIFAVELFVHALENEMLIVIGESLSDLFPESTVFFLDVFLIRAVAEQPSAVDRVISVAVNVDYNVQVSIVAVVNYLCHSVEPVFIHFVSIGIIYLAEV